MDSHTHRPAPSLLLVLSMLLGAPPLIPATIDVDGGCTLADAITAANDDAATGGCPAGSGADEIRLFGNVTLLSALPTIANTSEIALRGNGFRVRRHPTAADFRIFEIPGNGTLTLDNVRVSGGAAPSGAGIRNEFGTLAILNSTVSGNTASGIGGGGVSNRGTLTVVDSVLTGNSAVHGGAIDLSQGSVVVLGSHLVGNHAEARGGAVHSYGGALTIADSTISGNTVTGGPGAPGHNAGGGVFIGGNASLINTTVSGNSIDEGNGGGLFNYYGFATLTHSTVAENSATGPSAVDAYFGYTTLAGSVVSGVCGGYTPPIDGGNSFGCGLGALSGLDPALTDNGGPTPTHALEAGSSAIDAAGSCSESDQRGYGRNGDCDSGAFEFAGDPGSVGGSSSGVDTLRAACANRSTGARAAIPLAGASDWNCEAAGVAVALGDSVSQVLFGQALSDGTPITGGVTGMRLAATICENLTAGITTTVFPAGLGKSWDCSASGLTVSSGDRVRVTLRGSGE